ncbi:hypothetical protein QAD02_011425 [Eretmocerus hayati]|uniref:Uncharacterized protein n=1 Tax=Eretmocerus hayati TaxID=131215 RepID=A0ACC2NWJ3_9HYME|nr:hypothetical protein QAD02_011425 [Eretmocerus hayati]
MSDSSGEIDPEVTVTQTYKWIIEESCLTRKKNGKYLKSPEIRISDTIQCRIWLYPKGMNNKYKDYVSIYMNSVKGEFEAKFHFYILNAKNEMINSKTTSEHLIKENEAGWGFHNFIKHERLIEENMMKPSIGSRGRILTVACEVINRSSIEENLIFELEYLTRLKEFDNFEKLVDNDQFSDVVFTVDNKKLHAHKNILANRSEIFAAKFTTEVNKNSTTVIELKEIEYDVMKELLRYIYVGYVNDLEYIAMDLFVAADEYSIENLKKMCERQLTQHISAENVLEFLNFASDYDVPILKLQCLEFVKFNKKKVVKKSSSKLSVLNENIIDEVFRVFC